MLVATYPFKKTLKQSIGKPLRYQEVSLYGAEYIDNGTFCVVGPGAHQRKWYARVTMKNGLIQKVS